MKEILRALALELGADVCGFADIGRFTDAPAGFGPADVFAGCRTVIVLGVALPRGALDVNPRIVYNHANTIAQQEADRIAFRLSAAVGERFGGSAVAVPGDTTYEYWYPERKEGRGILSMKHAAVQAGIGTLGKSTLLLNRRFGTRLDLAAVLTELDLAPDPLADPLCLPNCRLCLDSCPAQALDGKRALQKPCREHTYATNVRGFHIVNCNTCRRVCPMASGLA